MDNYTEESTSSANIVHTRNSSGSGSRTRTTKNSSVCSCEETNNNNKQINPYSFSNEPVPSSKASTNNNNNQQMTPIDDESTADDLPKMAIASLIGKYENTRVVESEEPVKVSKMDIGTEKTICINNRLYLLINNGLFQLDYSYSKLSTKNNMYNQNLDDSHKQETVDQSTTATNLNDSSMNRMSTNVDEDFYKIIDICQPSDIIRIIVKCEQDNFEPNERNYICIIDSKKHDESVFVGITIDCKDELQIGLVIDYNHIDSVEIVGDGCIHLNLKFEHSKSIQISPVQNFWRTLQYLPTLYNQYKNNSNNNNSTQNTSEQKLKKSKSYSGLVVKESSILNTASLVNRYLTRLSKNNRVTFLWHNNDYHTSELLGDVIMEIDDTRKAYKKQLTDLLVDIMIVPNAGDLTLTNIHAELSKRFNEDLNPYKCFIANETIRIYGKMEMAHEILPYLFLGSDFNASDFNFLKSHNITHVLNATKEINNFYIGTLHYFNVSIYDRPESDILPYFNDCFRFIESARENGSNILVHCHMGISRSASVVIAYLMKKFKLTYDEAYDNVKKRRSLIRPNSGFIKQLRIYEAMVHNKRVNFENNTIDDTYGTIPLSK